jgi:hypothetical protein
MLEDTLPSTDLDALRRTLREAHRINAVIVLAQAWSAANVATALLIDTDTARICFKGSLRGGLDEFLRMSFVGS